MRTHSQRGAKRSKEEPFCGEVILNEDGEPLLVEIILIRRDNFEEKRIP